MTPTGASARGSGKTPRYRSSTVPRLGSRLGDGFHLTQPRQALERLRLDLAHPFARQAEAAADLLERLRLRVVEPVAQDQDLPLPVAQCAQRLRQRLAAQRDLDLLVGQWAVAGDEIAEDRVLGLADRLVE